jgi:acetolactate synthase-1/2/3 large subunit
VDVDGDASFSMTAMELATANQYNIGVKVLLFNNEFQGMVEQWQGELCNRLPFSAEPKLTPQTSSTRTATRTRGCTTPTLSSSPSRWAPRRCA